jgi:hypothetical protein
MSGTVRIGPADGHVTIRTYREGLAAQAGHDLVLAFAVWSATAAAPDGDAEPSSVDPVLEAHVDLTSLRVIEGTGGVKPLTDRDKRDIAGNARKVLDTEHHPEAVYRATGFTRSGEGGVVDGTLSLHGVDRPLRLAVTKLESGGYRATATVRQTEFGIRPYSGFFGALKLRDTVEVEAEAAAGNL